jgi:hypothetical protein
MPEAGHGVQLNDGTPWDIRETRSAKSRATCPSFSADHLGIYCLRRPVVHGVMLLCSEPFHERLAAASKLCNDVSRP